MNEFVNQEIPNRDFKAEYTFNIDEFKLPQKLTSAMALARSVASLLIMEPGTMQDFPDIGIGLKNYQFEYLTQETIATIQETLNENVNKYIPRSGISSIRCFTDAKESKPTATLIVGISISEGADSVRNFFIVTKQKDSNISFEVLFG